jgi:hypothetical protein
MSPQDATCDELLAAGWGEYDRCDIPNDWQSRRPPEVVRNHFKRTVRGKDKPAVGGWKHTLLVRGKRLATPTET